MLRSLASRFLSALRSATRSAPERTTAGGRPARGARPASGFSPASYAGDFTGTARVTYAPDPDGQPDPGEIVWTWVPFEEDYGRGKDRPVLIVARTASLLLCLMLTSKDHDGGAREENYIDIGAGPWDPARRPSEVKVDRVLQIDPGAVRREGAVLDRERFDAIADALRDRGWR